MERKNGWLAGVVLTLVCFSTSAATAGWAQAASCKGMPAKSQAAAKPSAASAQKPAAGKELLDINTASVDQLKALPGVGDAYSKRIVDGRPYTAKNQLTQKGIIPQATYDKIKDQIVAHKAK